MNERMRISLVKWIGLLLIVLFMFHPVATAQNEEVVKAGESVTSRGTMKSLENVATVWMYGTHALTRGGEFLYALESDFIELRDFVGKTVVVQGIVVHEGLEGGPPLLDVRSVEAEVGQGPPMPPSAFYGVLTLTGGDLPENALIIAKVNGEVRSATILENERYASEENPFKVYGEGGDEIKFYTAYQGEELKADQTATFEMGKIECLDLTFTRPTNKPPTADSDGPYSVDEENTVLLDGTESSDPDGDELTFSWVISDDPTSEASLTNAGTSTPVFDAPTVDNRVNVAVELTVDDGYGHTASDTVTVAVENVPPAPEEFPWAPVIIAIIVIVVIMGGAWFWRRGKLKGRGARDL